MDHGDETYERGPSPPKSLAEVARCKPPIPQLQSLPQSRTLESLPTELIEIIFSSISVESSPNELGQTLRVGCTVHNPFFSRRSHYTVVTQYPTNALFNTLVVHPELQKSSCCR
ncbi:hypothetical protein BDN72DRAFT_662247 [Pluteus cervinus]|uniref:Uncharacterized protein n=1 Tax=Pluteus cervinus TaxID=181527 RepID=A0ACD2ZZT8_9AGAR|nr:hypothetical protein BDN72DRAFT_662247 [Pluteus cervinus]